MKTKHFERHPFDLSTEELTTYPNGGKVVVYNAIDRSTEDYKRILSCATFFAQQGKQVVMPSSVLKLKAGTNAPAQYSSNP